MKRKIAWLALPLVLAALMFGVKWRAEHPTATQEDIKIRAWMGQADQVEVTEDLPSGISKSLGGLSRNEIASLANNFYGISANSSIEWGTDGTLTLKFLYQTPTRSGTRGMDVTIDNHGGLSRLGINNPEMAQEFSNWDLHPVTTKRWLELLLSNPRIGPELRARMKR